MNFIFDLKQMDKDEIDLIPEFTEFLLKDIKKSLFNNCNYKKLKRYESYLLKSGFIQWKKSPPKQLNIIKLCEFIINSFECTHTKDNKYSIHINKSIRMPNTYTKIDNVARLIDKGNDKINGSLFISVVIHKYMRNINKLFQNFISEKLKRLSVRKCIKIV